MSGLREALIVAHDFVLPYFLGQDWTPITSALRAGNFFVTTGEIFAGELPTIEARFEDEHDLATLLALVAGLLPLALALLPLPLPL